MFECVDLGIAGLLAHEPLDDTRVAGKWSCIRVVSGDVAAHRVFHHEGDLKTNCPLDRTDRDVRAVDIRHDTSCSFQFDIAVGPLEVVETGEVVLERPVSRHCGGLVKGDVAGIDGDVLVLIDVVRDFLGTGLKVDPVSTLIRVELGVGEVHDLLAPEVVLCLESFCELHGVERGLVASRVPEVVRVDVHRVREAEILVGLDKTLDNLCRSDIEIRDRVVDRKTVQPPSPGFSPAGVDNLDRVTLRHTKEPGNVGCSVLDLMVLEILEHEPVVSEDRECPLVDDGCVADLLVDVAGKERGHCGFHCGGIAHLRVLVAGLERGRDRCPATHPLHAMGWCAAEELVLGPVDTAEVDLWARDMGMDLHSACHDGLVLGIDNFCRGADLVDYLPILN